MYDEHGDGGIGDSPRVTFGRSHQARYTKLVDSEQVEVGYVTPPPVNSSRPPISETGTLFEADPQDYIVAADGQHPQGVVAEEVVKEEPKPLRLVIFVTIAMFMGYAILVSFQHKLKVRLNIKDDGSQRSHVFSVGVSMQYIGNLIFRMAHNFIFFFIKPRHRVYLSMIAMGIAMFLLGVLVFALDIDHLAIIFVAYGLGGVGIGSFESNLLSAITPLGHQTKVWAIIGFPVGFACVLIGGFMLTAIGVPTQAIYLIVCGAIIAAAALFFFMVPVIEVKNNAQTLRSFIDNVKHIREWFPQIAFHSFALMVDMFFVSLFSGIMLYIYNDNNYVPIFGENSSVLMSHDWYFVVYNFFTLCGDSISRRVAYHMNPRNPLWFLILSGIGAAGCLSKIAFVAPVGIFLVFYANGSVYATSTRHIDTHVAKQYNLTALSFWLFIGDIGSVIGSNVLSYIQVWFCAHHAAHMCVKK